MSELYRDDSSSFPHHCKQHLPSQECISSETSTGLQAAAPLATGTWHVWGDTGVVMKPSASHQGCIWSSFGALPPRKGVIQGQWSYRTAPSLMSTVLVLKEKESYNLYARLSF